MFLVRPLRGTSVDLRRVRKGSVLYFTPVDFVLYECEQMCVLNCSISLSVSSAGVSCVTIRDANLWGTTVFANKPCILGAMKEPSSGLPGLRDSSVVQPAPTCDAVKVDLLLRLPAIFHSSSWVLFCITLYLAATLTAQLWSHVLWPLSQLVV